MNTQSFQKINITLTLYPELFYDMGIYEKDMLSRWSVYFHIKTECQEQHIELTPELYRTLNLVYPVQATPETKDNFTYSIPGITVCGPSGLKYLRNLIAGTDDSPDIETHNHPYEVIHYSLDFIFDPEYNNQCDIPTIPHQPQLHPDLQVDMSEEEKLSRLRYTVRSRDSSECGMTKPFNELPIEDQKHWATFI